MCVNAVVRKVFFLTVALHVHSYTLAHTRKNALIQKQPHIHKTQKIERERERERGGGGGGNGAGSSALFCYYRKVPSISPPPPPPPPPPCTNFGQKWGVGLYSVLDPMHEHILHCNGDMIHIMIASGM